MIAATKPVIVIEAVRQVFETRDQDPRMIRLAHG
jgi:hypothetical protein